MGPEKQPFFFFPPLYVLKSVHFFAFLDQEIKLQVNISSHLDQQTLTFLAIIGFSVSVTLSPLINHLGLKCFVVVVVVEVVVVVSDVAVVVVVVAFVVVVVMLVVLLQG
jgi:hypothetical protein